jgi:hypothetical protein
MYVAGKVLGWDGIDLVGYCEHGNETFGSIKCFEILEWLHKDSTPCS